MGPRKPSMRVIALAATKGGVGKTTLSAALAVRAARESDKVALIDLDPQESLACWWDRRIQYGLPTGNLKLFECDTASEGIELLISQGWEWVFIDTPPAILDRIEPAIAAADVVLIPTRPSALDLLAIGIVEELCEENGKPYAIILNQCLTNSKLTTSAATELTKRKRLVLEPHIGSRQAYIQAMTVGKSPAEIDRKTTSDEIDGLWEAVKKLARKVRA